MNDLISDCCGADYGFVKHPDCSTRMSACKKCKKRCNVVAPNSEAAIAEADAMEEELDHA